MNQYKVFTHPNGSLELVKQGWSWAAFCFGFIWGCYKKLWWKSLSIFTFGLVISIFLYLETSLYALNAVPTLTILVMFFTGIVLGLKGTLWHDKNLITRGFEEVDTVEALNSESAMAVYLKSIEKS